MTLAKRFQKVRDKQRKVVSSEYRGRGYYPTPGQSTSELQMKKLVATF